MTGEKYTPPGAEDFKFDSEKEKQGMMSPEEYGEIIKKMDLPMTYEQQTGFFRKFLDKRPPEGVSSDEWSEKISTEMKNRLGVSVEI